MIFVLGRRATARLFLYLRISNKEMKKIDTLEEYQAEYDSSVDTPELFWAGKANSFYWYKKWDSVLNWNFEEPNVKWFEGGEIKHHRKLFG